jgi:hypothetical protein
MPKGTLVSGYDPGIIGNGELEIPDESILNTVGPAVDEEFLPVVPGILDNRGLADVDDLLDDVEFAEPVGALISRLRFEIDDMLVMDVLDMPEPVVDEAETPIGEGGGDAGAAVMANHKDVAHFQIVHGELEDRKAAQVGMDDDVGDVAMDENFPRDESENFIGRDAAVGTANPQIFRMLGAGEAMEEFRIFFLEVIGPGAVPGEEVGWIGHKSGTV